MIEDKQSIIELLTGVKSSKQSYYMELKKTIRQLEKKNMKLEIINDVTKSFNINMSIDDMLGNVFDKLKCIISFDRLSLSLFDKDELMLSNVYPLYRVNTPATLPKNNSLYWQAVHEKKPISFSLSKKDHLLSIFEEKILKEENIESVLLIPLVRKGAAIGVISFESIEELVCEIEDLSFLEQLADQLAVCIENARLYNAVLQGKKEWEETFKAVLDMLIFVDMDGTIIRYNDAVPTFLKLPSEQLDDQKCHEILFQHLESDSDSPLLHTYETKQTSYRQITIEKRMCDLYTYPVFSEKNEMYGVIIYMKDVTDKMQTEAKLLHSGKLAAIGEMAAGIAHELNSPLTAILGNSQLLMRQHGENSPTYQLLADIKSCGDRCKNIIRNLLTFSRQDQCIFEQCSVNHALEQVLTLIGYQIERQNIKVVTNLTEELPLVEGTIQQIEQVVINLLLNAKDALCESRQVSKKIEIETGVKFENEKHWVYLSVKDNGVGINEKNKADIFNPFFTTKEATQGNGLGLSVSLGIAKMHGGTIQVISKEGEGSCFTFFLPKEGQ